MKRVEGLENHKKDFSLREGDISLKIVGTYEFYFLSSSGISWRILAQEQNIYQNL